MTDKQLEIVIGGLLHDVGKILYRYNDGRSHGESGYEFLKKEAGIKNTEILHQVRFHHASNLGKASIKNDSLAYITYIADNIAARMDRRNKPDAAKGFVKDQPLESVFNILNGNRGDSCYHPMLLDEQNGDMNYPTNKKIQYSEVFYSNVKQKLLECLNEFEYSDQYINSLSEVLEACFTYVPSSTARDQLADISLYDHVKITAAVGSCIYQYAESKEIVDYKEEFYKNAKKFYQKDAFLLYSMDVSGIQDFIYTISSKGALKGLRSRSFYLEIMMEHLIDTLLDRVSLSRVNLIYSGGGHAYLLLPNTEKTKQIVKQFEEEINQWFLDNFDIALYVAGGMTECSTESLCNIPEGSYKAIFRKISNDISYKKMHRYTPTQIIRMNQKETSAGERECRICRRSDRLINGDQCEICYALEAMSREILYGTFFTVLKKKEENALPLPGDYWLVSDRKEKVKNRMQEDNDYIRTYGKNKSYIGNHVATKLWVGDYVKGDTFEELAKAATGVNKIAVMRADVDNLGKAFVSGFESGQMGNQYVTLSRTAVFSRKLSMFFKYHINSILKNGKYNIVDLTKEAGTRNIVIVYSGGDDVFVIGSWNDVIGFAIDLYQALKRFTQGTLTISAGIGLYPAKFPIAVMAQQTGMLEDAAKNLEGKDAVALLDERYLFHWQELIEGVLEQKLSLLKEYFDEFEDKGMNFLYNMLEFIRNRNKDKINIARYAYLLGRIAPDNRKLREEKAKQRKELYEHFSKTMYQWIRSEKDAEELEMAIYLYVYMNRKEEEKDEA